MDDKIMQLQELLDSSQYTVAVTAQGSLWLRGSGIFSI